MLKVAHEIAGFSPGDVSQSAQSIDATSPESEVPYIIVDAILSSPARFQRVTVGSRVVKGA